jgi:transcriptional regulator GlxA family with amidase domain
MEAPKQIGILVFDGVEELDAVGPWEVLAFWTAMYPQDGYAVLMFSPQGGRVRCAKGMTLSVDHSYSTLPPLDVLVYPGGVGTLAHLEDPAQLEWVRRQSASGALMTSVCTGSLVFAAAGLLAGRPATTHWYSLEHLARLDPTIEVRRDQRYVDSGEVITAAGVSAGIDMALHLVARLASPERAREVAHGIEYEVRDPASLR